MQNTIMQIAATFTHFLYSSVVIFSLLYTPMPVEHDLNLDPFGGFDMVMLMCPIDQCESLPHTSYAPLKPISSDIWFEVMISIMHMMNVFFFFCYRFISSGLLRFKFTLMVPNYRKCALWCQLRKRSCKYIWLKRKSHEESWYYYVIVSH